MSVYDDVNLLNKELWDFGWFQRQCGDQKHLMLSGMVENRKKEWVKFCDEYKARTGEVFLHSAVTLQRLRLLHDIHDESDPEYRGIHHAPPGFDWTYALPFFTNCIRLTGATGSEWSLTRRPNEI